MSASALFAGLAHLGVRYSSARDLAAVVRPYARAALDDDRPVFAVVDDDVASAMRSTLGPAGERVRFQRSPHTSALTPEMWLGQLHAWSGSGRRALVVGQYSAVTASAEDRGLMEDGVNLLLRDHPLTLLCACPDAGRPEFLATARRTHPAWLDGGTERPNPGYRAPADHSPVPAGLWGRPVLRTTFHGLRDLARIRAEVVELVCEMGLCGTAADAAVLAVHEAAALACRFGEDTGAPVEPDAAARSLEIRATGRSLFGEVRGPAGRAVPHAEVLRRLRWFCHRAEVHDDARERTIRVLTDLRGPPVDRWLRH